MKDFTQAEPWWAHHPSHMKGWEAFGVTGGVPTVRRLGLVTTKNGRATTEEKPGTTPWASGEVRLGVAHISFGTYADDPEEAFLHVVGTTEEDVRDRWHRASTSWPAFCSLLWPKSRQR